MKEYLIDSVVNFGEYKGLTILQIALMHDIEVKKEELKKVQHNILITQRKIDSICKEQDQEVIFSKVDKGPNGTGKIATRLYNRDRPINYLASYIHFRDDFYVSLETLQEIEKQTEHFTLSNEHRRIIGVKRALLKK